MEANKEAREELERLRGELAERRRNLPAHTVRVHQIQALEELEDRVRALEELLAANSAAKARTE